eukprot:COSAG01_NODE_290_length_19382_cov_22.903801_5_plen_363_part_00
MCCSTEPEEDHSLGGRPAGSSGIAASQQVIAVIFSRERGRSCICMLRVERGPPRAGGCGCCLPGWALRSPVPPAIERSGHRAAASHTCLLQAACLLPPASDMPSTPRRRRSNKSASPSPSPRHQSSAQLNPPTDPHEFGGVFGTAATTVFLPLVVIFLAAACQRSPALDVVFFNDGPVEAWKLLVARVGGFGGSGASYRWAFAVCLGWLVAQAALERFLPAEVVPGVKLRDGTQLRYRMNGHLAFWVSVVLALHGWPHILKLGGRLLFDDGQKNVGAEAGALVTSNQLMLHFTAAPLQLVHDHFLELAVASIVVALGELGTLTAAWCLVSCDWPCTHVAQGFHATSTARLSSLRRLALQRGC